MIIPGVYARLVTLKVKFGTDSDNKMVPPSIKYFTMLGIKLYKNKP